MPLLLPILVVTINALLYSFFPYVSYDTLRLTGSGASLGIPTFEEPGRDQIMAFLLNITGGNPWYFQSAYIALFLAFSAASAFMGHILVTNHYNRSFRTAFAAALWNIYYLVSLLFPTTILANYRSCTALSLALFLGSLANRLPLILRLTIYFLVASASIAYTHPASIIAGLLFLLSELIKGHKILEIPDFYSVLIRPALSLSISRRVILSLIAAIMVTASAILGLTLGYSACIDFIINSRYASYMYPYISNIRTNDSSFFLNTIISVVVAVLSWIVTSLLSRIDIASISALEKISYFSMRLVPWLKFIIGTFFGLNRVVVFAMQLSASAFASSISPGTSSLPLNFTLIKSRGFLFLICLSYNLFTWSRLLASGAPGFYPL